MITRRRFIAASAGAAVACGSMGLYNKSASALTLEKHTISVNGLPSEFNNFKIGLLSDLHSSGYNSPTLFDKASEMMMSQEPDLIALLGDFINSPRPGAVISAKEFDDGYVIALAKSLSVLRAEYGIYGVMGNHDHWSGKLALNSITNILADSMGLIWLRNRHVRINKGLANIALLGVDDYWSHKFSLPKALKGLIGSDTKILLSHNPDVNAVIIPKMGIDLILSGHTHGGQIKLPFIGSPFVPSEFGQRYIEGIVRDGQRATYVSRGVGSVILPTRFNSPPEVTILTLTSA
jgi:hypothetical protein